MPDVSCSIVEWKNDGPKPTLVVVCPPQDTFAPTPNRPPQRVLAGVMETSHQVQQPSPCQETSREMQDFHKCKVCLVGWASPCAPSRNRSIPSTRSVPLRLKQVSWNCIPGLRQMRSKAARCNFPTVLNTCKAKKFLRKRPTSQHLRQPIIADFVHLSSW